MSKSSTVIFDFQISQGRVATQLRWDGRPSNSYIESLLRNLTVKEFGKSVYICRNYDQKSSVLFFIHTVYTCTCSRKLAVKAIWKWRDTNSGAKRRKFFFYCNPPLVRKELIYTS